MKRSTLFFIMLSVLAFSGFSNPKIYKLEYKFDVPLSINVVDEYQRTTVFGNGDETGNSIKDEYELLITKDDSKNSQNSINLRFEAIKRTERNPGGVFKNDFPESKSWNINARLGNNGEILETEGFKNITDTKNFFSRTGSDHWMHRYFTMLPELPSTPISVGDSWSYEITNEWPFPFFNTESHVITKYECQVIGEVTKNGLACLEIQIDYKLTSVMDGEMRGRKIHEEYSGIGKETVYFAIEKGMILSKQGTMNAESTPGGTQRKDKTSYNIKVNFDK